MKSAALALSGAMLLGPLLLGNATRASAAEKPPLKQLWTIKNAPDLEYLKAAAFSPDGKLLATAGTFNRDAAGVHGVQFWDADSGQQIRSVDRLVLPPNLLAFSPCGTKIVAGQKSLDNGIVTVIDVPSGKILWQTSDKADSEED